MPQFLVVLTYSLVAEEARMLEFCYPTLLGLIWCETPCTVKYPCGLVQCLFIALAYSYICQFSPIQL